LDPRVADRKAQYRTSTAARSLPEVGTAKSSSRAASTVIWCALVIIQCALIVKEANFVPLRA
jgi:hypothetical protein